MLNPRSSKDRAYTSPIWELYFLNDAKGYIRAAAVDANGDRFDEGDISKGDFYTALELGYKAFPRTDGAGYSKLTLWHTDGTSDGSPINANTGSDCYSPTSQQVSDWIKQ